MGQQLPLPAGWAKSLFSSTDPAERLSDLVNDRREAFGDIRLVLDRLSAKYRFKPREIDAAMGQVDDVLGDLFYETKEERECKSAHSNDPRSARGHWMQHVDLPRHRRCRWGQSDADWGSNSEADPQSSR